MNFIICDIIFFSGLALLTVNLLLFISLKKKTKTTKILTTYVAFSLIEGLVCFKIYYLIPEANFLVSHFYFALHLVFVGYFFYHLFEEKLLKKIIPIAVASILLGFMLFYILNPANFFQFNLLETTVVCCFLASLGLINIYQTLGTSRKYFYFSVGVVLYFLCTAVIYLTGNIAIVFNQDPYLDQWIFKDLFFIVFQIFLFKEYQYLKSRNE